MYPSTRLHILRVGGAYALNVSSHRPNYLFEFGDVVSYGPASALLRQLVAECGDWFETVVDPLNNWFGYAVYRLNHEVVEQNRECPP